MNKVIAVWRVSYTSKTLHADSVHLLPIIIFVSTTNVAPKVFLYVLKLPRKRIVFC